MMLDFRGIRVFLGYILLIVVAELLTSFVSPSYGLVLHSLILLSLLVISSIMHGENPVSGFYLSLSLAPLIRIISLSVPLVSFPRYAWYIIVNVPVLVATVAMMRIRGIRFKDAGIRFGKPGEVALIALTGIPFGFIDYLILRPESIATGLSFSSVLLLALGLGFSTGFVEELIFRGLMQPGAIEIFGERRGLVGVSAVFASLHIGWLSLLDLGFVFSVSLFFGYTVLRKGNIIGVTLSHGITNVVLFLVAPYLNLI